MHIWREPLVHFLLGGASLFLLFRIVAPEAQRDDLIVVGPQEVTSIVEQFRAQTSRPPNEEELDGLVETWIREEVLYREAIAMGLDERDTVVRRRLAQKLGFLLEGSAQELEPDDTLLRTWFDAHPDDYAIEPMVTFEHVFFGADRRVDAEADARAALAAGVTTGDPFLLPSIFRDVTQKWIARDFGEAFAAAVASLEVGDWRGPIRSEFGWHLVRVTGRAEARVPTFDEIRDAVRQDWLDAEHAAATDAAYQELRARYEVVGG